MHERMNTEAWIIDRYVRIPSLIPQNISISEWLENESERIENEYKTS
jgi:hypothetical protein